MTGTTSSPPGTASAPPGMKSFCASTTTRQALRIATFSSPGPARLQHDQLDLELAREHLQLLVDLGERHRAVDLRLPAAEEVQVGAVQDQNFHFIFQFFSRLAMSAGLKWQYACSRAYTAM